MEGDVFKETFEEVLVETVLTVEVFVVVETDLVGLFVEQLPDTITLVLVVLTEGGLVDDVFENDLFVLIGLPSPGGNAERVGGEGV